MAKISNIQSVVLASGHGTRMKSVKSKILHHVAGKPLLYHTIKLCQNLTSTPLVVVVNQRSATVKKLVQNLGAIPVVEKVQTGNAKSLETTLSFISKRSRSLLVLNSDDSFLYKPESILKMITVHIKNNNSLTFLTAKPERNYTNVSRKVMRDSSGNFSGLQPSDSIRDVVCGAYVFNLDWLKKHLPLVKVNPTNKEYQIVDLLLIALKTKSKIEPFLLDNPNEWWGVNTKEDLMHARKLWKKLHG